MALPLAVFPCTIMRSLKAICLLHLFWLALRLHVALSGFTCVSSPFQILFRSGFFLCTLATVCLSSYECCYSFTFEERFQISYPVSRSYHGFCLFIQLHCWLTYLWCMISDEYQRIVFIRCNLSYHFLPEVVCMYQFLRKVLKKTAFFSTDKQCSCLKFLVYLQTVPISKLAC